MATTSLSGTPAAATWAAAAAVAAPCCNPYRSAVAAPARAAPSATLMIWRCATSARPPSKISVAPASTTTIIRTDGDAGQSPVVPAIGATQPAHVSLLREVP